MARRERRRRLSRGAPIRVKAPFPFNLFTNVRVFFIIGIVIMVVGLIPGIFATTRGRTPQQQEPPAVASPTPSPDEAPPSAEGLAATPAPAKRYAGPPPLTIDSEKRYFVTIRTERGDLRLELLAQKAPETVNNFLFLAREGFYDGLTFHWVVPDFVAQAGDPTGAGAGGPGYRLPLERNDLRHEAGVVAMAQVGEGSLSGSQFYITLAPQLHLDGRDTVFGRVVAGMELLKGLRERRPERDPNAPAGVKIMALFVEERE